MAARGVWLGVDPGGVYMWLAVWQSRRAMQGQSGHGVGVVRGPEERRAERRCDGRVLGRRRTAEGHLGVAVICVRRRDTDGSSVHP